MDFRNRKVLLVDDMMTMRKIIRKSCEKMSITNIVEAKCGNDAWEIIASENGQISLIISDWNMPNGNGIELLKRVRLSDNPLIMKTYFVMVTAEKEYDCVKKALDTGVDNFVSKPFTQDEFEERIRKSGNRRDANKGIVLPKS